MSNNSRRIALLDELRGFCVLCMIFYHAFIFMGEQYDIQFGLDAYRFFLPVQPYVSCMFLFICGICCRFSHSNLKRGLILVGFALALNFVSIVLLPKFGFTGTEILFGVLDFFAICILGYVVFEKPITKMPAIIGCIICLFLFWIFRDWIPNNTISLWDGISWTVPASWHEVKWLFPIGIEYDEFYSADYFPLIPYGFIFYLGAFVGKWIRYNSLPDFVYPVHIKALDWLGRHCFIIYLIELPIIFIILEFITWIIGKF